MLANDLVNPRGVIWHPDNERIGFVDKEIGFYDNYPNVDSLRFMFHMMPIMGGNIETIIEGDFTVFAPSWSPNGQHLIFSMSISPHDILPEEGLYILPATGGEPDYMFPLRGAWAMQWHDTSFVDLGIDFEDLYMANADQN